MLSNLEKQRYQRHLQLAGFSEAGQEAMKNAHVVVIGLGGLGCPAAVYLAAAGIGQLTLVDGDAVSLPNLQRQVLFTETDISQNKAMAAAGQLVARNSTISVTAKAQYLDIDMAEALFSDADIVLDCTDNFHTRYLINDVCHQLGKPWVYASVLGFSGQFALFQPGGGCFRCLFPELNEVPDCNQAGVLGAVPGILGTQQALAAIKYLAGMSDTATNKLYSVEGLDVSLRGFTLSVAPGCPLCSGAQTYRDRIEDYQPRCSQPEHDLILPAADFTRFMLEHKPLLVDIRPPEEHSAGNLGGINIPMSNSLCAELEELCTDDLTTQRPVLLYCLTGKRSAVALTILQEEGLENVLSLGGGIQGQDT